MLDFDNFYREHVTNKGPRLVPPEDEVRVIFDALQDVIEDLENQVDGSEGFFEEKILFLETEVKRLKAVISKAAGVLQNE